MSSALTDLALRAEETEFTGVLTADILIREGKGKVESIRGEGRVCYLFGLGDTYIPWNAYIVSIFFQITSILDPLHGKIWGI